jgi:hypothetical protein
MSYSLGYPLPRGPVFDVNQTVLAGMTVPQLQAAYASAQAAYVQLMAGGKVVTAAYAQGNGSKSVTYNMTSAGGLLNWIGMLQKALGMPGMSRRPMRPIF